MLKPIQVELIGELSNKEWNRDYYMASLFPEPMLKTGIDRKRSKWNEVGGQVCALYFRLEEISAYINIS